MLEKEMIEMAKTYKKKIAGSFVLVDGDDIDKKIAGSEFVSTKKIDGALYGLFYEDSEITAVSTTGKILKGIPCLDEACELLKISGLKSAVIEAELYAILKKGTRERVGDVSKALADKKLNSKLFLAPFDIVELDGEKYKSENYLETIKKLYEIFNGKQVKPAEYKKQSSVDEIVYLYKEWVEDGGAEGIVLHNESPIVYKIKPHHTVDAAIVGFTLGEGDESDSIRDLAFALKHEDDTLQIIGVTGNGLTDEQRKEYAKILIPLACDSEYIIADSRNVAFQMVKPELVAELSAGDYVPESSDGMPKINPLLRYDENKGYISDGNVPGVSVLHLVFVRMRDDKTADKSDIRLSQITDICPFSETKPLSKNLLKKSTVIAKRIFTKGSGEKLMIQKYVVWKTNKEGTLIYPSYVFFYTDFSCGRKEMLKRDLCVSSDKEQAMKFMDSAISENVKKGWEELK